jgi:hypothetical protein
MVATTAERLHPTAATPRPIRLRTQPRLVGSRCFVWCRARFPAVLDNAYTVSGTKRLATLPPSCFCPCRLQPRSGRRETPAPVGLAHVFQAHDLWHPTEWTGEAQGLPPSVASVRISKLSFSRTLPHTLAGPFSSNPSIVVPHPACGPPTSPARTSGNLWAIYHSIGPCCAYAYTLLALDSLDSGLPWLHDTPTS